MSEVVGPALGDDPASVLAAGAACMLRPELAIEFRAAEARYMVHDPHSDLCYALGPREMLVARLFDGRRSLKQILAVLNDTHQVVLSPARLAAFERRLLSMGLLAKPGTAPSPVPRDPATGISYGPMKARLMITLLRIDPSGMLDAIVRRAGWLVSPVFVAAGAAFIAGAVVQLVLEGPALLVDVRRVYGDGLGWLAWHYPFVLGAIFLHELGHALACRAFGVRVTELGIGMYLVMATGWARPLQRHWSTLDRRQRLVTIAMGPFASLLVASAGVFLWTIAPSGTAWRDAATIMATSVSLCLVPTLLPMFNGDAYLALAEITGVPRLRQRAFAYVKALPGLRRAAPEAVSAGRRWLYVSVVLATVAGWTGTWVLAAFFILSWRQTP